MAAQIKFYAGGYGFPINDLSGSGLGQFGTGGFGQSVPVGEYQDTTFITNSDGTTQGPQTNNVKYITATSGQVTGGTTINNLAIPNYQSTLNIRLTNSTPVKVQNARLYVYDRVNINNAPSGATVACAHVIHPSLSQVTGGSGSTNWEFPAGSSYLDMSRYNNGVLFSPGASGLGLGGSNSQDVTHDWYLNISMSPNSIGSKLSSIYFTTDYL